MKNLLEKLDLFYSLATAGDRKSYFNKLSNPTVNEEIAEEVRVLADKISLPEFSSLKSVAAGDFLNDLKKQILEVAAATVENSGSVYTDTMTVLTKINRSLQLQTTKRD